MRSLFLNSMLAVGMATVLVIAGPAEARGAKGQKRADAAMSMTGCLEKGDQANTYKLTGVGRRHSTVEIVETASGVDLASHVGHKVTVSGKSVNAREALRAEGTTGTKGERSEARERRVRADSVKMVSAKCP